MISRIRQAACTLAAAALAASLLPASALAAISDVSYGEGASATTVGIRLQVSQISVDAPVRITFADKDPVDVAGTFASMNRSAEVTFVNRSKCGVRLVAADVVQNAGANIGNLFDVAKIGAGNAPEMSASKTDPASGAASSMVAQIPDTKEKTPFSISDDHGLLSIGAAENSTGSSMTIPLRLKFTKAMLKDADAFKDESLKGNPTSLCSIVWTFAQLQPTSDELLAKDGFYLEVADSQVGQANGEPAIPQSMLGKTFSLAEMKAHSRALSDDTASQEVKDLYKALVTSMAPEGDYDCRVRYNGLDWPVRIIGLNQDVAAESFGEYSEGDLVGLTFQFRDLIDGEAELRVDSHSSAGGWGGENAQDIRNNLNTDGTYYNNMAIKDSIVPVKKFYSSTSAIGEGSIAWVSDKMFLASYFELTGNKDVFSSCTWIPNEGTGKNHNEQYLFYKNKGIVGDGANFNKWLVKNTTRDWETSKVTTTSGGNLDESAGDFWWERSVYPSSFNTSFMMVEAYMGRPSDYDGPNNAAGVCPCFCI